MPLLILILAPIFMGISNVTLRKMNKLHPYTSAAYIGLGSFVVFGTTLLIKGNPLSIRDTFEAPDYIILLITSSCGTLAMITKAKAMQYESASRLSIMTYASVVLILVFDLAIIGTRFKLVEAAGMLIIFAANGISVYSVYLIYQKK